MSSYDFTALAARRDEQRAALEEAEEGERLRARVQAQCYRTRAKISRLYDKERSGFVEIDFAGTALIGQLRAHTQLADAVRMVELYGQALSLLADGVLYVTQVETLLSD